MTLLIRHLHAMTKIYPEFVSTAFRKHLKDINDSRINEGLRPGDLILFTAVSTIFPTSDNFHPVVTPSMLVMCRWLGQVAPNSIRLMAVGTYLVTLCAQVCFVLYRLEKVANYCSINNYPKDTCRRRFLSPSMSSLFWHQRFLLGFQESLHTPDPVTFGLGLYHRIGNLGSLHFQMCLLLEATHRRQYFTPC
jgi:hypothetical protein